MSNVPPEDLIVAARGLDPAFRDKIAAAQWDEPRPRWDWRAFVPLNVRRLWDRLDYESRVAVFVVAATAWHGASIGERRPARKHADHCPANPLIATCICDGDE